MVFLHSHGVGTSRAVRIYKFYGESAIDKVRANPYALAKDIHGIGFKTADQIAQRIGIPRDSLLRAEAGLTHVLIEAVDDGHCALPKNELVESALKLLEIAASTVLEAFDRLLSRREVLTDDIAGEELVFLPALKRA